MKTKMLFLWLAMLASICASAAEMNVNMKDLAIANGASGSTTIQLQGKTWTYQGFSFYFEKNSTPVISYQKVGNIQIGYNTVMTVTAPEDGTMSRLVFAVAANGATTSSTGHHRLPKVYINGSEEGVTYDTAGDNWSVTWEGAPATEVKVTVSELAENGTQPEKAGILIFSDLTITYNAVLPAAEAPVISPDAGTYGDKVTVSITAAPGAEIHYIVVPKENLGGDIQLPTSDSPLYTGPFDLEQTRTIKAIAIEEGKDPSPVTVAEFTVLPVVRCYSIKDYNNKTAWLDGPDTFTLYMIDSEVTVTYAWDRTLYVEDASGAMSIRGNENHAYVPGDVIKGFYGTAYVGINDNALRYMIAVPESFSDPISHSDFIYPEGTYGDLHNDENVSRAYVIKNVYLTHDTEFENPESFADAFFADGQNVSLYNGFTDFPHEDGWYDINGIVVKRSTDETVYMFYPTAYADCASARTGTPVPDVEPGTYHTAMTVTLSAPEGAYVYYTLDGSDPYPGSLRYSAPVEINRNCTLKAIAIAPEMSCSEIAVAEYVIDIWAQAEKPAIAPDTDEKYVGKVTVTITTSEGETAYYTVDGTEPTEESTPYSGPFELTKCATVKAFAIGENKLASEITEASFTICAEAPSFSPEAGTYYGFTEIALRASDGMCIAYTLDGTTPTEESDIFDKESPIVLKQDTTIKAIAFGEGVESSEIAEAFFEIVLSGVESVCPDSYDPEAIYYDLDGHRVTTPAGGRIYVKIRENKVSLVLVR